MNRWLIWIDGLLNAAVHGFCVGFSTVVIDPATFNIQTGKYNLLTVCILSAAFNAFNWMKQSPMPIAPPQEKPEAK